jgi:predicted sugar kinase
MSEIVQILEKYKLPLAFMSGVGATLLVQYILVPRIEKWKEDFAEKIAEKQIKYSKGCSSKDCNGIVYQSELKKLIKEAVEESLAEVLKNYEALER